MIIYDRFGRPIKNLRVILTSKCNYNCIFCHSEGYYHCGKNAGNELGVEDVRKIARVARDVGVRQVKITGGEPLIVEEIYDIVRVFREMEYKDISLVTNGSLLSERAYLLKEVGLSRINVSLPSLNEERYDYITGTRNMLRCVIDGIKAAIDAKIFPVKINVVLLKDINSDEWKEFIKFAEEKGVYVQFIEYHTNKVESEGFKKFYFPITDIEKYLEENAIKREIREMHARKRYTLESGVEVELVRPMFNPTFCANCTRIRATPTGWKPCLMREDIVPYTNDLKENNLDGLKRKLLLAIKKREPYFKKN
ncbi:MAG: GTP 3',8-cyclase MoaA [Candidatus Njordarchaeota archaeon]